MVKTPKTRHSKSHREPVTIELEPGAVSRVEEADKADAMQDAVSATVGEEATAENTVKPAPSETDAKTDTQYASYDYSFDNAQPTRPEAQAPKDAASSSTGSSHASSATAPAPAQRQVTSGMLPGLAGGLIALLVAGGLQYAGVLGAPGGPAGGDAQMQSEIASLKSELADLSASNDGSGLKGELDGLKTEVGQVKSEVDALKSTTGQAGSSEALAVLDQRINQIETAVSSLSQGGATSSELTALNERIAALDAAIKATGEATTADDGKIATLEQSVSSLTSKVDAQASQPKIAMAIAASALKAAVDRGAGFGAELETFAAISPDAPELAALRAQAEKGVPTRAEIVAATDAAANAMIVAAKPVNDNAGIFERLVSSAEQLVQVRPIGAVEGAGVPETVARMEVAVTQGDFAKALAEYDTLPEAAKAAGADFIAKLKARLDVETLVDKLVAGAMKA
ncbi:phage tail protein [Aminobacter sp. AP02]|uniref:COG4223 family protein n=1 Tax=Aminobacter sp. AP02 TaxID=2135737 RepID=UPI000D6B67C0|nr:phage tail protein [Aminobacter sp. AP02]PWK76233.1 hypothetical protein C8K44_102220 [Aminobacter sp. AP02]